MRWGGVPLTVARRLEGFLETKLRRLTGIGGLPGGLRHPPHLPQRASGVLRAMHSNCRNLIPLYVQRHPDLAMCTPEGARIRYPWAAGGPCRCRLGREGRAKRRLRYSWRNSIALPTSGKAKRYSKSAHLQTVDVGQTGALPCGDEVTLRHIEQHGQGGQLDLVRSPEAGLNGLIHAGAKARLLGGVPLTQAGLVS